MGTNYLLNSLLVTYVVCRRVVNPWNNLPHNAVDFSSLSKFKRCLIRADLSKYTYYIVSIRLVVSAPVEPFYLCLSYWLCMLLCNYV